MGSRPGVGRPMMLDRLARFMHGATVSVAVIAVCLAWAEGQKAGVWSDQDVLRETGGASISPECSHSGGRIAMW